MKNVCPGSGKPTRTDGSCDRCSAKNVIKRWQRTQAAKHIRDYLPGPDGAPPKRRGMISLAYAVALKHEYVPRGK